MDQVAKWVATSNGFVHQCLRFQEFPDDGPAQRRRSVFCTAPLEEGVEFLRLPRSILLQASTSRIAEHLQRWEEHYNLNKWDQMILAMLYEMTHPPSAWQVYLDALPKTLLCPRLWSPEDIYELRGTSAARLLQQERLDHACQDNIMPIVEANPNLFETLPEHTLFQSYVLVGSLVMAYSFTIGGDGDEEHQELAMVPIADALNHRTGYNNARLFSDGRDVVMKTTKAMQPGAQLYNTYGDLGNAELLHRYGFVDYPNPYTSVELELNVVCMICEQEAGAEKWSRRSQLLEDTGIDLQASEEFILLQPHAGVGSFHQFAQSCPPQLLLMVTAAVCSEAQIQLLIDMFEDGVAEEEIGHAIIDVAMEYGHETIGTVLSSCFKQQCSQLPPPASPYSANEAVKMARILREEERAIWARLVATVRNDDSNHSA